MPVRRIKAFPPWDQEFSAFHLLYRRPSNRLAPWARRAREFKGRGTPPSITSPTIRCLHSFFLADSEFANPRIIEYFSGVNL